MAGRAAGTAGDAVAGPAPPGGPYRAEQTGENGWFQFCAPKNHGYYFNVVLPSQGPYLSCTSYTR